MGKKETLLSWLAGLMTARAGCAGNSGRHGGECSRRHGAEDPGQQRKGAGECHAGVPGTGHDGGAFFPVLSLMLGHV